MYTCKHCEQEQSWTPFTDNMCDSCWEKQQGFFVCVRLHKVDFISRGYDPKTLTDDDMAQIASKIGDNLVENGGYWESIEYFADLYKLSEIKE